MEANASCFGLYVVGPVVLPCDAIKMFVDANAELALVDVATEAPFL
jgi:hypothetical protein